MNPDKITTIYGPPGTGKTTYLLNIVDELMKKRVSSKKISFLAFTRKASNEAKDRAMEKFKGSYTDFFWFRTIHSLCYHVVSSYNTKLIDYDDYKEFGASVGMSFSYSGSTNVEEGIPMLQTKGDKYLHYYNLLRATGSSVREIVLKHSSEYIDEMEFEFFIKCYSAYKKDKEVVDFTDLLITYLNSDHELDIDYLIVDEAQDLSRLQWLIIEKVSQYCKRVYIAGDDDQAIYRWSGADVDALIKINCRKVVLDQSYRVPSKIHTLAKSISSKISNRVEKRYYPTEDKGDIIRVTDFGELPLDSGTWLLLARNNCYLEKYIEECLQRGFFFECPTKFESDTVPSGKELSSIVNWQRLINGKSITSSDFKAIVQNIRVKDKVLKYGAKKAILDMDGNSEVTLDLAMNKHGLISFEPWYKSLNVISNKKKEYIVTCLKKGEKLSRTPRIKISTIHGVKGGEAENVALLTDMTLKTFSEFHKDTDSEHRVWYVAVTRAKKNLYVFDSSTPNHYEI